MVVELARHIYGDDQANSTEFDRSTPHPVIDLMPDQRNIADMGGTMRLVLVVTLLWVMAVLYNVKPFRTKDRLYLDVVSESINNPIRLALGWFVVTSVPLPPSSLTMGYWMLGAYLMGVKRLAEMRLIGPEAAGIPNLRQDAAHCFALQDIAREQAALSLWGGAGQGR